MTTARIRFYGAVQGVGFRYFVRETADALGLSGSVQNLADGSVEALVIGKIDHIESLVERLQAGNGLSHIARLEVIREEGGIPSGEFIILRTNRW